MRHVVIGQVDYTVLIFIPDPASTDGSGKTGLVAANLTAGYTRVETDNDVVHVDGTGSLNDLISLTAAHADWNILEVSSSLAPGLYRLDLPDGVFAAGAWSAVVYVMITASAAAPVPMEFALVAYNPHDAVRLGLTALPNAAAEAAGGLYTRGTGAGQINQPANGLVNVNATQIEGTDATDALDARFLAFLKLDWTGITGEASRSLLNALRFLRNKWSVSGGTLTVTKEDDTASAWTSAVTTDAAAEPIIGSDPS